MIVKTTGFKGLWNKRCKRDAKKRTYFENKVLWVNEAKILPHFIIINFQYWLKEKQSFKINSNSIEFFLHITNNSIRDSMQLLYTSPCSLET